MTELEQSIPERIVIDLAGLTFIDSSGINVLVQAARTIEARGGSIVLAAPSRHVRRVFEIARVGDIVEVATSPRRRSDGTVLRRGEAGRVADEQ